ncbi:hypothetical protein ACJRO7_006815, partial [Eucalyptus globulus]
RREPERDEVASISILCVCGTLGSDKRIHMLLNLDYFQILSSKCIDWNINAAENVFNNMPAHDVVSSNGLIACVDAGIKPGRIFLVISAYKYTKMRLVDEGCGFFSSMRTEFNIEPSQEHYAAAFVDILGFWGLLELAEKIFSNMPFEPEALV